MALGDFADAYGYAIRLAQRDSSLATDVTAAKLAVNAVYFSLADDGANYDFFTALGSQAMVVGQEAYTFTTIGTSLSITCNGVLDLQQTFASGPELHYLKYDDYISLKALNPALANGVPVAWTIATDSQILVWPKPNATTALTVLALKLPTELTADGTFPFVPTQYVRSVLGKGAAIELLLQEGGTEAVQQARELEQEYMAAIAQMRENHALNLPVESPAPLVLPAGLTGTTGTFLDLAQRTCYLAGTKPWKGYDIKRAKDAVNEAILFTAAREKWSFLEAEAQVTIGTSGDVYTFDGFATALSLAPHSVGEIVAFVNDTSDTEQLILESWEELERLSASTQGGDSRGFPTHYAIWERRVRFYPYPDQSYTLGMFYVKRHGELSADTDTTLFPASFVNATILPYAASSIVGAFDRQQAELLRSRYEREVNAAREAHASNRVATFNVVAPSFNQWFPGGDLW